MFFLINGISLLQLFHIQKIEHVPQQTVNVLLDHGQMLIRRMLLHIKRQIIFNQGERGFGFMSDIDEELGFLFVSRLEEGVGFTGLLQQTGPFQSAADLVA